MEEQQRLEIAARIKELRERSPYTQPIVADKLGLRLRSYQRLEERGTTKWERAEALAVIYDVTPEWIWTGEEKGATPDLLNGSQLDRLERKLDRLLAAVIPDAESIDEAHEEAIERELAAGPALPAESDEAPQEHELRDSRRAADQSSSGS